MNQAGGTDLSNFGGQDAQGLLSAFKGLEGFVRIIFILLLVVCIISALIGTLLLVGTTKVETLQFRILIILKKFEIMRQLLAEKRRLSCRLGRDPSPDLPDELHRHDRASRQFRLCSDPTRSHLHPAVGRDCVDCHSAGKGYQGGPK